MHNSSFPFGSYKFSMTIDKHFFKKRIDFYKGLLDQDKKNLLKYLYLSKLEYISMSFLIYVVLLGAVLLLSYDTNVEGSIFGLSIGFRPELLDTYFMSLFFYIISPHYGK